VFSHRLPPHTEPNALSRAVEALRQSETPFIDLTESNPTAAGFPYAPDLLAGLADPQALAYTPHPFGLTSARAAVAAEHARRGIQVDPGQVVLTASTSEAYTWLFKLLCNPGECVLVPRPSYPLFEHLTRLEAVRAEPYDLTYHGRWEIDFASVHAAPADTRAVLVVSPNNPTGSYVSASEYGELDRICQDLGWALVADEVFAEYPLEAVRPVTALAARPQSLTFSLGGLSKSAGLPQLKLGWLVAAGESGLRGEALNALELIADSFLSVGTPVQVALPRLLQASAATLTAIQERTLRNLRALREIAARFPACEVLKTEGGWCAVIRVPATMGEEQLVLGLLKSEGVLVHPGYFFDFPHEAFVVISLLPREDILVPAMERVLRFASR
jgi:alanine-synthesizing transaminase